MNESTDDALPDDLIQTGSIHIAVVMGEGGTGTTFKYDGVGLEAAIGHVQIVLDRLREEAAAKWAECPCCGDPYEEDDDE